MPGSSARMLLSDDHSLGSDTRVTCSRAQCGGVAAWTINWRNPRIHGADRVKIWLACDTHRDWLKDYLAGRDFPVEVTPVGVVVERLGQR